MIKSDKGSVELVGKVNQILAELAMIVQGVYYTLCEKKGNPPEAVHAAIMEAVKLGLDADAADVAEVKASDKTDEELVTLLEQIEDFLRDD